MAHRKMTAREREFFLRLACADRGEWFRHTTELDDFHADRMYEERPRMPVGIDRRRPGSI